MRAPCARVLAGHLERRSARWAAMIVGMDREERDARPTGPHVDYRAVYQALPAMIALFTPDLAYVDVNEAYERNSGRRRDELVGLHVFDVFPDNPQDPEAKGAQTLKASLERVLDTGRPETMPLQRYDVQAPDPPHQWQQRFWSTINIPLLDADGRVTLIVHRVEEVTKMIEARNSAQRDGSGVLEADVYNRSQELYEANEELRQAHAHERVIALALQDAMLPNPHLAEEQRAAVRYQPAVNALNVCGDWYDLIELPDGGTVVAVGDVAGHGLIAAGVMGQLRSALSAAARISTGPARTLEALGLYSRSVPGAESSTAACVLVDGPNHRLTYSSAGHLPPALVREDGTVIFLDQATDPPLGARPQHEARPEAQLDFTEGDTLVLYTDGLIERRREDIDVGLARLAEALTAHRSREPEQIADALLHDLLPESGAIDDTALVVVRL